MAGETQKVWNRLLKAQEQLVDVPEEKLTPFIDVVVEEYGSMFNDVFGGRALKIHSMGAYVIEHSIGKMYELGEQLYLGDDASLGIFVMQAPDVRRILFVDIDANAIANPPADKNDFEPLFMPVRLPIMAITNIREAA
jgi:hypothetical protein